MAGHDPADPASLLASLPADRLDELLPLAAGRMRVKLRTAAEAFQAGVPHVVLADGRVPSPVLAAVGGAGSAFVKEAA